MATARAERCDGDVLRALEEQETKRKRRCEGEGRKLTPSPLFNSEGRSCARDLLRTISVTNGELPHELPHDRPHGRPQEANRSVWRTRSCKTRGAARATRSKHLSAARTQLQG